jgi:hypothetical protein
MRSPLRLKRHWLSNPTKKNHDEAGIRIHNEDRRSRSDELTEKLVYLAIHQAPMKRTMRIRIRRESLDHWRFPVSQILLKSSHSKSLVLNSRSVAVSAHTQWPRFAARTLEIKLFAHRIKPQKSTFLVTSLPALDLRRDDQHPRHPIGRNNI